MKKQLIISHSVGALFMDLESHSVSQILSVQYKPKSLVTYKDGLLFTTSQKSVYFWKSPSIDVFAGKEEEEISRDGTISYCRFYEAAGITVEFDNIIYVYDRSVGSVLKALKEAVQFLDGLQYLAKAFFVHEQHRAYAPKSLDEAISLVSRCTEILFKNIETILSVGGLPHSLNGWEGSVSGVTVDSI